jgi:hypothetical protein
MALTWKLPPIRPQLDEVSRMLGLASSKLDELKQLDEDEPSASADLAPVVTFMVSTFEFLTILTTMAGHVQASALTAWQGVAEVA